jgi:hypothetical protein
VEVIQVGTDLRSKRRCADLPDAGQADLAFVDQSDTGLFPFVLDAPAGACFWRNHFGPTLTTRAFLRAIMDCVSNLGVRAAKKSGLSFCL